MLRESDERVEAAAAVEAAVRDLEAIANLPSALDVTCPVVERGRDYRAFWEREREVTALFKGRRLWRGP